MVGGECFVKKNKSVLGFQQILNLFYHTKRPYHRPEFGDMEIHGFPTENYLIFKWWVFHINVNLLQGTIQIAGLNPVSSAGASCDARWGWVNASIRMGRTE